MKKVYSVTMVKNEADIIESFVRYHRTIVDGMLILDNGSTDNTLNILHQLKSEGYQIEIVQDDFEYLQAEKTTSLMRSVFENHKADIVFPLDADEFLTAVNQQDHPRKLIEELDPNSVYYLEMMHYFATNLDDMEEIFVPKRMTYTMGPGSRTYKVAVPRGIFEQYSPTLVMGNHDLSTGHPIDPARRVQPCSTIGIAHYSLRSIEQMKSKVIVGWLNNLARYNRTDHQGTHWHSWYNRIKENKYITVSDLVGFPAHRIPINLSFCDPVEMKYTRTDEVDSFQNLLLFSESVTVNYARLRAEFTQRMAEKDQTLRQKDARLVRLEQAFSRGHRRGKRRRPKLKRKASLKGRKRIGRTARRSSVRSRRRQSRKRSRS